MSVSSVDRLDPLDEIYGSPVLLFLRRFPEKKALDELTSWKGKVTTSHLQLGKGVIHHRLSLPQLLLEACIFRFQSEVLIIEDRLVRKIKLFIIMRITFLVSSSSSSSDGSTRMGVNGCWCIGGDVCNPRPD